MKAESELPETMKLRSSKYLNNLVEQDHRGVKTRTSPMLGFKRFQSALIVIARIELTRLIYKSQFNVSKVGL
jgi:transposase-like protein